MLRKTEIGVRLLIGAFCHRLPALLAITLIWCLPTFPILAGPEPSPGCISETPVSDVALEDATPIPELEQNTTPPEEDWRSQTSTPAPDGDFDSEGSSTPTGVEDPAELERGPAELEQGPAELEQGPARHMPHPHGAGPMEDYPPPPPGAPPPRRGPGAGRPPHPPPGDRAIKLEELFLSDLYRMVTAAAFWEQTLEEAPSALVVVTADDIRASGARTLGEAIELCAGLELMSDNHILIRGMGQVNRIGGVGDAGRILLLIDGVRINDVFSDSFTVGLTRSVGDIDRIEVLKGPGSAMFGTSAFAGVIQVITRRGDEVEGTNATVRVEDLAHMALYLERGGTRGELKHATYLRGEIAGDDWSKRMNVAEFRGSLDFRGLSFVAGYQFQTGTPPIQEPAPDNGGSSTTGPSNTDDPACADCAGCDVCADCPDCEGCEACAGCESCYAQPENAPETTEETPEEYRTYHEAYVALRGEHMFTRRLHGFARLSATGRMLSQSSPVFSIEEGRLAAEGRLRYKIHPSFWLTGGIEARGEAARYPVTVPEDDPHTLTRRVAASYAQAEFSPLVNTTLTLGVRAESISPVQDNQPGEMAPMFTPRLGLVTSFRTRTIVKAFYGTAYQAPSLSMLYYPSKTGNLTIYPNPNLNPELLHTLELEADQYLGPKFLARLNLFHNDIDDLITITGIDDLNAPSEQERPTFENAYDAYVWGLETGLNWDPMTRIRLFGNLTWMKAQVSSDEKEQLKDLPLVPNLRFNLGFKGRLTPRATGWLAMTYTGKREGTQDDTIPSDLELAALLRLDARIGVDITRNINVALSVRNLLDAQGVDFVETQLVTTPGRIAWLELTYHMDKRRNETAEDRADPMEVLW